MKMRKIMIMWYENDERVKMSKRELVVVMSMENEDNG